MKGKLSEQKIDYSVYGISLGKFPAEVCALCGEKFFEEKIAQKIEDIEKEKGLFGLNVRSRISYSGNALIIRVPQKIAKMLKLTKGMEVVIHPEGKEKLAVEIV